MSSRAGTQGSMTAADHAQVRRRHRQIGLTTVAGTPATTPTGASHAGDRPVEPSRANTPLRRPAHPEISTILLVSRSGC